MPAYLPTLEAAGAAPADAAAAAAAGRLRGDCHSHSDWSDGGSPIAEMAEAAAALGHEYLALTDHSPRLTVAHGLDPERLRRQLEVVAALNAELAPFRILTGIEVDILEDGALDQDQELLARLDVVVASVHSKLRMDARADDPPHGARPSRARTPTSSATAPAASSWAGAGRQSTLRPRARCSTPALRTGTAVEINSRPERLDPPDGAAAAGGGGRLHGRRSTPTPTPRVSSNGWPTAASRRRRPTCPRNGS